MRRHKDILLALGWCALALAGTAVVLWWTLRRYELASPWVLWVLLAFIPLIAGLPGVKALDASSKRKKVGCRKPWG